MSKNKKKIIGMTGPSKLSPEVQVMVEEYFGATPVYINQNGEEDLTFILSKLDGIILAGGADVCPISYGQEIFSGNGLSKFDKKRDDREFFIINWAFANNVPILGICRGHQILGINQGLPFIPHIGGSEVCHSPTPQGIELDGLPCHYVWVDDSEDQKSFFKKEFVNSFHHQAISLRKTFNYAANGVKVIGYAYTRYPDAQQEARKIVELMSGTKNRWISCQWHPEANYDDNKASQVVLTKFAEMINE